MTKTATPPKRKTEELDASCASTAVAALLALAMQFPHKFPHRQFNSSELSILSGTGRVLESNVVLIQFQIAMRSEARSVWPIRSLD